MTQFNLKCLTIQLLILLIALPAAAKRTVSAGSLLGVIAQSQVTLGSEESNVEAISYGNTVSIERNSLKVNVFGILAPLEDELPEIEQLVFPNWNPWYLTLPGGIYSSIVTSNPVNGSFNLNNF